jgi:hypothetical protein
MTGINQGFWSKSPMSSIDSGERYRLVGKGIKFTYVGTNLNRGGMAYILWNSYPNLTPDQVIAHPNTETISFAEHQTFECHYRPITHTDNEYYSGIATDYLSNLYVVITNAVTEAPVNIDMVGFYEVIGEDVPVASTPSHADPVGHALASNVIQRLPSAVYKPSAKPGVIKEALNALTTVKQSAKDASMLFTELKDLGKAVGAYV